MRAKTDSACVFVSPQYSGLKRSASGFTGCGVMPEW